MKLLNKLERKFGKIAIPNLMTYIIFGNLIAFILGLYNQKIISQLMLYPEKILNGEIWRIFTFIFIPPDMSPIFIIFALLLYYTIGTSLEHEWGTFKFNIYYLIGCIGIIIASFIFNMPMGNGYLNLSLFLAFARLFPDFTILIFFVLPVKIKYLAWIDWAVFIFTIIFIPGLRIVAIVSLINYFIFFGKDIVTNRKHARSSYKRKQKYNTKLKDSKNYFHKCEVCGRTEKDDENLEFRYCSKCNGEHEYCMDHLFTHEHIK